MFKIIKNLGIMTADHYTKYGVLPSIGHTPMRLVLRRWNEGEAFHLVGMLTLRCL